MGDPRLDDKSNQAMERWKPGSTWVNRAIARVVIHLSKLIMTKMNDLEVVGMERFEALRERGGRGLLTFSNHVSLFDDPWIPSNFGALHYDSVRWVVADAHNFFGSLPTAFFFSAGKCVPIVRGAGIDQPGFDFLLDRLRHGDWVHIFPEGGRTRDPEARLRKPFKAGIGKLISETKPWALPFFHTGMQHVLPIGERWPKSGNQVKALFGEATDCDDSFLAQFPGSGPELWQAIANWAHDVLAELEQRITPEAGQTPHD
jgi:monolysocardiolipin acyltransferase